MELSNNARFLRFVRIMVDETRKDEPLTRQRILQLCKEDGFQLAEMTFERYINDMEQAGIIIKRQYERMETGQKRNLYWYHDGWI